MLLIITKSHNVNGSMSVQTFGSGNNVSIHSEHWTTCTVSINRLCFLKPENFNCLKATGFIRRNTQEAHNTSCCHLCYTCPWFIFLGLGFNVLLQSWKELLEPPFTLSQLCHHLGQLVILGYVALCNQQQPVTIHLWFLSAHDLQTNESCKNLQSISKPSLASMHTSTHT
jgi:hypothetical protein